MDLGSAWEVWSPALASVTTHPPRRSPRQVAVNARAVTLLSGGRILLTWASVRGEEEVFPGPGETFRRSDLAQNYIPWNLRDPSVPPYKEENPFLPFLSTLLLILKCFRRDA